MSIETFMSEFHDLTEPNPFDNRERVWNDLVAFDVKPFSGSVRLSNIRALSPGKGHGTLGLLWLTALADKNDASIIGTAEPTLSNCLSRTALKKWYRRHGFAVMTSAGDIEYTPARQR